jgi:small subunit ribosomal protein S9
MATKKTAKKTYDYYATGRRKTSVARVYASPGTGKFDVNGKPLEEYFTRATCNMISLYPLEHAGMRHKFDFTIRVKGGGEKGQAGAVSLGISRTLLKHDETMRLSLRKEGLLTRDSRSVERKKVGLRKARRAKQFSKR